MKRITLLVLATAVLGIWMLPASADHSRSTGINCSNFAFQEDAQAYFEAHPGDPEGLDGPIGPAFDGIQGVACEALPKRGTQVTTTTTTVVTTTTTVAASGGSTSSGGSDASATTTTVQPATTTTVAATAAPATASQGRVLTLTG